MISEKTKGFSFVLIGKIFSTGLTAAFYLVFASFLTPDMYGNLIYIIAIAAVISIVSRFGLNHSVVVYRAKNNSIFTNQVNFLAALLIFCAGILLLIYDVYAGILSITISLAIMYSQNLLGLKKYKKFLWMNLTKGLLIILLPLGFYYYFEFPGILIGLAISYFVVSIPFFKFIKIDWSSLKLIKNNYKTLFQNFGVDSSSYLVKYVDKLLIVPLLGFVTVGLYQFNIQILFGLEIIPIALHGFLLSEESSGKKHKKIEFLVLGLSTILVVMIIIFAPILVKTFFPEYSDGVSSLQVLIITLIPLSFTAILNAKLQARESKMVGYSAFVRIGSMLALIAVLGPMFGLVGLAYSILMSVVFHVIFLSVIYYKTIPSMKET